MTAQQAKDILLLYRPGTADAEDPQVVQAIDLARHDPELANWFKDHCAFQDAMRAKLRQIPVPLHLKGALMARHKPAVPAQFWWRRPTTWLAPAAALVLFLALAAIWLLPRNPERFAILQARMVSTALREYRMDLVTNDMGQVRQYLASRGAPADYEVSQGLQKLELTGAGFLRWRNHPVAMVCFNRGDNQMLFLFVTRRSVVKDPPPEKPQLGKQADLVTASWSRGDKTYILAGPEEPDFARKYLPPSS